MNQHILESVLIAMKHSGLHAHAAPRLQLICNLTSGSTLIDGANA